MSGDFKRSSVILEDNFNARICWFSFRTYVKDCLSHCEMQIHSRRAKWSLLVYCLVDTISAFLLLLHDFSGPCRHFGGLCRDWSRFNMAGWIHVSFGLCLRRAHRLRTITVRTDWERKLICQEITLSQNVAGFLNLGVASARQEDTAFTLHGYLARVIVESLLLTRTNVWSSRTSPTALYVGWAEQVNSVAR